jgi:hypothetical protein
MPDTLRETSDFGRRIDRDLSTPALQYAQHMFPVMLLFDLTGFTAWMQGYLAHHENSPAAMDFWTKFQQYVWLRFQEYRVPSIKLTHDTPREAVCQVFEKVNTGGVTLTVFELCTATLAAEEFDLREDWEHRYRQITDSNCSPGVGARLGSEVGG